MSYNRIRLNLTDARALERLITRARQRAVWNLICAQAILGASCALAGAILLLVVGTSILDWYWLVALFGGGFGIGAWRTLRRLPSRYTIAQQVDRRLGLHDALSTALHFSHFAHPTANPVIVAAQRDGAESAAASIDPHAAWPFVLPRQTFHAASLLAVVLALGVFRYGAQGSLDLRAPLIRSVADFFWTAEPVQARAKKPPRLPGEDPLGIAFEEADPNQRGEEPPPDYLLDTVETPDVNAEGATTYSDKTDRRSLEGSPEAGEDSELPEDAEPGDGQARNSDADASGRQPANEPNGPKSAGTPQNSGTENSSLLDKMRDAMANLLTKLKIPPQTVQSTEVSPAQGKQSRRDNSGKGDQNAGKKQGKGSPSDDAYSSQEGQGEQQAQSGQGKSSDTPGDSSSNDPSSGIGKQDGDKAIRDAEQLAAMGKISEILGKRAQNVTGEIMIEVNSGKQQQLRTAYSNRGATHRESGGEIHRDEVPLEYQHYIQQYFEKVRSHGGESKKQ